MALICSGAARREAHHNQCGARHDQQSSGQNFHRYARLARAMAAFIGDLELIGINRRTGRTFLLGPSLRLD
jgi:hypothetical protein